MTRKPWNKVLQIRVFEYCEGCNHSFISEGLFLGVLESSWLLLPLIAVALNWGPKGIGQPSHMWFFFFFPHSCWYVNIGWMLPQYIKALPNSVFFGIWERRYQELPIFSGYMGSLLCIVLGLSFLRLGFPRFWGLGVYINSALSPDSLVLPLKVWKKSNKNQGMDSLCIQRALAWDLKELSWNNLEYLGSIEIGGAWNFCTRAYLYCVVLYA